MLIATPTPSVGVAIDPITPSVEVIHALEVQKIQLENQVQGLQERIRHLEVQIGQDDG